MAGTTIPLHVNTNTNVLGFINSQPAYKGKAAAIATSNLYPSILNKDKDGIFINVDTGSMNLPGLRSILSCRR